ncbi:hypothetical protein Tco_1182338 [Tanacetum coccineum]
MDFSPTLNPLPSSIDALVDSWVGAPTPSLPPPSLLSPLLSTLPRIPSPPLLLPLPTRRDIILEDDMPSRKRARFAGIPSCSYQIGERFRTADLSRHEALVYFCPRHDSEEFHVRHQDAQDDIAALRAHVPSLERQRRYHRLWLLLHRVESGSCNSHARMKFEQDDHIPKVEKYTGRLPDSNQESVMASKLKLLQEAIELPRSLMDQKLLKAS